MTKEKKAQIFTLDMALAIVVVVIIISGSSYFFAKNEEDFINNYQMVKTGSDIVSVLEAEGTMATMDGPLILSRIQQMLPVNYAMRLIINSTIYSAPLILESESYIPSDRFIISGKRFFVFEKNSHAEQATIRYEVWLK